MPNLTLKHPTARRLVLGALAILATPAALWLIGFAGGCVASSTASHCERLPDIVASVLFAILVFTAFGGWTIWVLAMMAAVVMLGLGASLERAARRGPGS